jgi:hypothetical protein
MAKSNGGRPRTGRNNSVTFKLSDEAMDILNQQQNKTAFIDGLLRGEIVLIKCPNCGHQVTIKTE